MLVFEVYSCKSTVPVTFFHLWNVGCNPATDIQAGAFLAGEGEHIKTYKESLLMTDFITNVVMGNETFGPIIFGTEDKQ